jgi:hypothetical protein
MCPAAMRIRYAKMTLLGLSLGVAGGAMGAFPLSKFGGSGFPVIKSRT